MKNKRRWYVAFSFILSAIFLYLAFRKASWQVIINTILQGHAEYLVLAATVSMVSFFLRSQRWGVLLSGERRIHPATMFWVTGIGYLGNNFLPLRAGEVIRSVVLGGKVGISKIFVITTAFTERILDALALIIIGLLVFPSVQALPNWLPSAMRGMSAISLAAIFTLFLAPRMEKVILAFITCLPIPTQLRTSITEIVRQFLLGAQAFIHPARSIAFIFMTAAIWLLDGIATIFASFAFSMHFNLPQSLLLLVALGLSSAIPSTPGYVGVYQFVAISVLGLFHYSPNQALAYILVVQALNMVVILVWGLIGLWRLGIPTSILHLKPNND